MRCPVCGDPVEKVHRHPLEWLISVFYTVRRYRCTRPDCGWEGSLHRDGGAIDTDQSRSSPASRLLWFLVGAAALYGGQEAYQRYVDEPAAGSQPLPIFTLYEESTAETVPRGIDHPGEGLAVDDPRGIDNRSPLKVRKGCAWGVPGANPYKGSVAEALRGTQLPQEVVRKLDYMVQRGLVSDRLEITNSGIVTEGGKRYFGRTAASMAFGDTLCFNTRVNFRDGHVEKADLYEATDARGEGYAIMIPYACNNVSVLAERKKKNGGGRNGGNGKHNGNGSIPEPMQWTLFGLGLLVLMWFIVRLRR